MYEGKTYTAKQMHLHAPGEHSINGAPAALELHFLFEAEKVKHNMNVRFVVVAVPFAASTAGSSSAGTPFLDMWVNALPARPVKGAKKAVTTEAFASRLSPASELFDGPYRDPSSSPSEVTVPSSEWYTYHGSLTTPPCTENVKWFVMKNRLPVSEKQIAEIEGALPFAGNSRPVQNDKWPDKPRVLTGGTTEKEREERSSGASARYAAETVAAKQAKAEKAAAAEKDHAKRDAAVVAALHRAPSPAPPVAEGNVALPDIAESPAPAGPTTGATIVHPPSPFLNASGASASLPVPPPLPPPTLSPSPMQATLGASPAPAPGSDVEAPVEPGSKGIPLPPTGARMEKLSPPDSEMAQSKSIIEGTKMKVVEKEELLQNLENVEKMKVSRGEKWRLADLWYDMRVGSVLLWCPPHRVLLSSTPPSPRHAPNPHELSLRAYRTSVLSSHTSPALPQEQSKANAIDLLKAKNAAVVANAFASAEMAGEKTKSDVLQGGKLVGKMPGVTPANAGALASAMNAEITKGEGGLASKLLGDTLQANTAAEAVNTKAGIGDPAERAKEQATANVVAAIQDAKK